MALNLKTLGVRSLTAAVFVVVLLGGILLDYSSFTLLFFIISLTGLNEFFRMAKNFSSVPFETVGYSCGILIYLIFVFRSNYFFTPVPYQATWALIALPFVLLAVALFSKRLEPLRDSLFTIGALIYAVVPFALLHEIVFTQDERGERIYAPHTLIGVIFLIWINDTFAYLGGSLFGKNKMMPSVSPGKTWEGTITGVLCSFAISFLFARYFPEHPPLLWPLLGIMVPVLATIGDLVQSQIKRQAGIKDTGNIMPGHGGILDRFDSLIFVAPFVVVILKLL